MKFRISSIIALSLAIGAGLILFQTSQNVQRAEDQLHENENALAKENEMVRVLQTEWDYLNRPDRIEELVQIYLKMQRPELHSLVSDSRNVIVPGTMIVPGRKPVLIALPLGAQAQKQQELQKPPSLDDAASSPALPMPAPVTNDAHQQFNALLNSLTQAAPSSGGAP